MHPLLVGDPLIPPLPHPPPQKSPTHSPLTKNTSLFWHPQLPPPNTSPVLSTEIQQWVTAESRERIPLCLNLNTEHPSLFLNNPDKGLCIRRAFTHIQDISKTLGGEGGGGGLPQSCRIAVVSHCINTQAEDKTCSVDFVVQLRCSLHMEGKSLDFEQWIAVFFFST